MRKKILIAAVLAVVLIVAGAAAAFFLLRDNHPSGGLVTSRQGISVQTDTAPSLPETTTTATTTAAAEPNETCWPVFGGNLRRSLYQPVDLGKPAKVLWRHALGDVMEFPPVYCNGRLYVRDGNELICLELAK